MGARVAHDEVAEGVRDRLEGRGGQPGREGGTEGVAQASRVLRDGPSLLAGHRDGDDLSGRLEPLQRGPDGGVVELGHAALHQVTHGERAEDPQEVGEVLAVPGGPCRDEVLQLRGRGLHGDRVEQLGERELLTATEEVGQQRRVEGERGGAALGQWGVSLVEELRDVAEHQRRGEGGGPRALDVDERHPTAGDGRHQLRE